MEIRAFNQAQLLEVLQLCAHRLLLAYDKTQQSELWDASEVAAEACQFLQFSMRDKNTQPTFH